MAKPTTQAKEGKAPTKVFCGECRHFLRDTEGRSRSIETGEYYMGKCLLGLHPDSMIKQFANKPRVCDKYRSNN